MDEGSHRILQFGTGRFLRSFVDLFAHEAAGWEVTAVQSTGAERADQLCSGSFHVAIRGLADGAVIDTVTEVRSVVAGLSAERDWALVRTAAEDPDLRLIVSNTTEAGLSLEDADVERDGVPRSYPAKLLDVLLHRFESGNDGMRVLPCELVEQNGRVLRSLVLEQAERWAVETQAVQWLQDSVEWCDTLVDRIVSAPPDDHPKLAEDPLLSVAEPFAFWAIATGGEKPIDHPAIETVPDVTPFALRKVRILNGAHTALVARALGQFETVREAMADSSTRSWMETLVYDELVPCVRDEVEGADAFAADVFERFDNPFLDHRLKDIALHQDAKVRVRLIPSYHDYVKRFGHPPSLLSPVVESYL